MIKMVILLRRRQGMTREEFIDYYEKRHVPLATTGSLMVGYTRNYILPGDHALPHITIGDAHDDFDVITEIWFENAEGLEEAKRQLTGELGKVLREDEAKLFDTSPGAMRFFIVEEYVTSGDELEQARGRTLDDWVASKAERRVN